MILVIHLIAQKRYVEVELFLGKRLNKYTSWRHQCHHHRHCQ